MPINFNTWTARNGQVRIYINGLPEQRTAKIWAEEQAPDTFGSTINIRGYADNMGRAEVGSLINRAEEMMDAKAGKPVRQWIDLISLTSK